MISNREKLAAIDAEFIAIEEKHSVIYEQENKLRESRILLVKDILAEEKPFEGTTWELCLGHMNSSIYFQYVEGNKDKIEGLQKLCFQSWHDSFSLQDSLILRFDDGDFSLYADEPRQLTMFAQKQNFIIIATNIEDKVRRLSRQLTSLQEICHQFNLKV